MTACLQKGLQCYERKQALFTDKANEKLNIPLTRNGKVLFSLDLPHDNPVPDPKT